MQLAWSSGTRLGPGHRNTMKRRTKQCHTQISRMILLQYSRPLNDRKGVYLLSWTPSCSSFGKIRMSLFTGLLRVVACVFTTTDLTRLWPSGSTCKTRANDQKLRGTFSSRISTISPSTRFRWGFWYLLLSCITTRYSFFYRDQNKFAKFCTLRHRRSIYTSFCWNFPGGGNITVDLVVKMWLGVSGSRSPGSPETVVKDLELIIASTSHMSVRNDSSSKQWPYSSIKPESNSFRAPTKFVPLSLFISLTVPRRLWSAWVLE